MRDFSGKIMRAGLTWLRPGLIRKYFQRKEKDEKIYSREKIFVNTNMYRRGKEYPADMGTGEKNI